MSLEVICIDDKGTKKLVKGQKYNAITLYEERGWRGNGHKVYHNGKRVFKRNVKIEGMNSYTLERFKSVDGRNFYDIPLFGEKYPKWERLDNNKNYTGQYVLCVRDGTSKYLSKDKIYFVEEHKKDTNNYNTHNKLKIKGLSSIYSSYNFKEISLKDQRNIKLKSIEGKKIETGLSKRKFLYYSDFKQKKIIFDLLFQSIQNLENIQDLHNFNIIDMIIKIGSKYNITKDDIEPLFNKSLKSIMKDMGLFF